MNKKSTIGFSFVFFLLIFSYMLIINHLFPKITDDFTDLVDFSSAANPVKLLITSVYGWYLSWSGRITVVFANAILLAFIPVFNILNPLVFCAFIYGIFINATSGTIKTVADSLTLLFIFFVLWFFIPEFAEVVFWKTGAITYLWPMTLCLFFIYPFMKLLLKNEDIISGKYFKTTLLIIGAALLGAAHELLLVPVTFLMLATNFICYRKNKKIPLWCVVATILFLIAAAILVLSPGNFSRAVQTSTHQPLLNKLSQLGLAIFQHYFKFNQSLPLGLLLLAALFLIIYTKSAKYPVINIVLAELILFCAFLMIVPISIYFYLLNIVIVVLLLATAVTISVIARQKELLLSLVFILLTILTIASIIPAPYIMFGDRTSFFSDTFFIIATISVLANIRFLQKWHLSYKVFCATTVLFLIPSMLSSYIEVKFFHQQVAKRENLIALYKNNNAPALLQPLMPNTVNTPTDPYLLAYNPHIVVMDLPAPNLAKIYHLPEITMRPFVELWRNLDIQPQQKTDRFNIVIANRTIYYVAHSPCDAITNKAPFSLQVYPKNPFLLPRFTRQKGYEELSFPWTENNKVTVLSDQGTVKNDVCVFATNLPNYAIKQIKTR